MLLEFKYPKSASLTASSLPNTIGVRHNAFRVKGIHSEIKRLEERGVRFLGECVLHPVDLESGGAGQKSLCYFFDPDGVLLELAEFGSAEE